MSIAKCLVHLKEIKNYTEIAKGYFRNSPDFEGFNINLSRVVKFKLIILVNTSKEFDKNSSVKKLEDYVFITFNASSFFRDLKTFVDTLEDNSVKIVALLEKAIEKYADELLAGGDSSKYNLPYGYSKTNSGEIVLDKDEASVAFNVFRMYIRLKSMKKVAESLGGSGVLSRIGSRMDVSVISGILHDSRYLDEQFVKVAAIIPASIFKKGQEILKRNAKEQNTLRKF